METKYQHDKILNFLKDHHLAVLATSGKEGLPNAAVVGIAVNDNLQVLFSTTDSSRKYHNLQSNLHVALVIGWEHGKTVQYEGIAEELSHEEAENLKREHFANVPTLAKYIHQEQAKHFIVYPRWIKYSDLSHEPWERLELKISA